MTRLGTSNELARTATIRKFNSDGTVNIALNEINLQSAKQEYTAALPVNWTGPNGEFAGGKPTIGSTVSVQQGVGGRWYIINYISSAGTFNSDFGVARSAAVSNLKDGEYLIQSSTGTGISVSPIDGIKLGNPSQNININNKYGAISSSFNEELSFTEAGRKIEGIIKRDVFENSNRNILGSSLDNIAYDKSLYPIGLDPTISVSQSNTSTSIRNLPLVESRSITYEFARSAGYVSDEEEISKFSDPNFTSSFPIRSNRRENRTDTLSLNNDYSNYLIEETRGTVVDIYGNILDLNRNILPIGQLEGFSLKNDPNKIESYTNIQNLFSKSIAYHFEINTRKNPVDVVVDAGNDSANVQMNYLRNSSNVLVDFDKEGQLKLNIPASSETGNIALNTRSYNYSSLLAEKDEAFNPNQFVQNVENRDIYLRDYYSYSNLDTGVKLTADEDVLDGYASPLDYLTEKPILLNTVYHDIRGVCSEYTVDALYIQAGMELVNFDLDNQLNTYWEPKEYFITDTLTVSGPEANAGGRSATIGLDGMLSMSIGANTVDRQSVWFDTAGGMVSRIGRDKQGVSWSSSMDGDVFWQVGGAGLGNTLDSRFSEENDAYRDGTLEIRVLHNGQISIFRMAPDGISLISPGSINISCQQQMVLRTNSNMILEAENIVMYGMTEKRIINRMPPNTTIG